MRRSIYSAANSDLSGIATADAGANQSSETIAGFVDLDASGSSTTAGGGITGWLWEIVSGNGLVIDSPTTQTTSISGTAIAGDNIIKLTVTDANGNTDTDTVTLTVTPPDLLTISSSAPDINGQGTLTFAGGQNAEVLNLRFVMTESTIGDSMTFSGSIMFGVLDHFNTITTGLVTLDGSGEGSYTYDGDGSLFQVEVEITGRSSIYPLPSSNSTFILI